ncbi:hypothetical protein B7494_g6888 [Chlorociboria aeruginascens]|nr:hypothetical protein B7494_g6888 [Chlorociboria aeruginascens]
MHRSNMHIVFFLAALIVGVTAEQPHYRRRHDPADLPKLMLRDSHVTTIVDRQVSQIGDGQVQAPTGAAGPVVTQIGDGQIQAPGTNPVTQIGDGQVQAPGTNPINQIGDGQVQAPAARQVTQIGDGQVQAPTGAAGPVVTQIGDGQVQAPGTNPVTQIGDGQVQAPGTNPINQIGDGQIQAPAARQVTQIGDGQVQAPTGAAGPVVTQIGDGQVQAPGTNPVTQIGDGQVQAPGTNPINQIGDGQVQAPAARQITQIGDGQVQAPTSVASPVVTQISDGQVQVPTGLAAPVVTQIGDGQIQAPTGALVTQIGDGQIQAPTGAVVTQIGDGQVQAPTGAVADVTSSVTGAVVTQIGDGQVQAPTTVPSSNNSIFSTVVVPGSILTTSTPAVVTQNMAGQVMGGLEVVVGLAGIVAFILAGSSLKMAFPVNSIRSIGTHPSLASLATVANSDFDVELEMSQVLCPHDPNDRPKCFRNLFEECIFVFTVMLATASTTFVQGVVIINTARIGKALHMTEAEITWISAAIGLASGSFMLIFGKTADLFGRKIQLLAGMAWLSIFSLVTAFAPTAISVDVLCGFLGLGTAVISPPAIGILFAVYPEGSISSGVATKYFSWRVSFMVISVFFFIMTLLAIWTTPSIPRSGSIREAVKDFDYVGSTLTLMGMALFSSGLTEGPDKGWKSPRVLVLIILGAGLLFAFAVWENIYKHPLLDPVVWKNRNFSLCILTVGFGYMSFITNQFWISLYMQDIQKYTPLHIAATLLPQAVVGILWSYIGQSLVTKVSGTILMGIGACSYLVGAILLIFIREHSSYWAFLFPALLITVIGADFQFIVSNLYINTQMPDQASLGAGVLQTVMRLSVSFGLGITSAVFGSVSEQSLTTHNITLPYERAYLCSILFAIIGLLFVPFMKIDKMGRPLEEKSPDVEEAPRTASEYSNEAMDSKISIQTAATASSIDSFFPRWSWEGEQEWREAQERRRQSHSNIIYEVCIKCMEERRVVLYDGHVHGNHH